MSKVSMLPVSARATGVMFVLARVLGSPRAALADDTPFGATPDIDIQEQPAGCRPAIVVPMTCDHPKLLRVTAGTLAAMLISCASSPAPVSPPEAQASQPDAGVPETKSDTPACPAATFAEMRTLLFGDIGMVLIGKGWHCYLSTGPGAEFTLCKRDLKQCEDNRVLQAAAGSTVGPCNPSAEAFCVHIWGGHESDHIAICTKSLPECQFLYWTFRREPDVRSISICEKIE